MALAELREPGAALRALRAVARERRAVRAAHGVELGDALSLFASRHNAAGVVVATARVLQPRPAMVERDAPVLFAGRLRDLDAHGDGVRDETGDFGQGPFVLVALGTMFEERPEIFAACVAALRDRPEAVVVAHGRTDPAAIGTPGPSTVLRPRVPQVALLARSRAFVSHGGLNSVTEALWHGVPLVLLPQAADQPLNAARVERLGAGVRVRDPTAATIRAAVERVLADPSYTRAARALGDRLRASAGPGQAADFILRAAR
jgi:MGT family glycosyltransferase